MKTVKEKQADSFKALKDNFGYVNPMQSPRLLKVVVSAGVGSFKDKKKIETVEERLSRITGQKAARRGAKRSVASYKTRQGDPVGVMVTLRGRRMFGFLDKLLHTALPRTRDFRGIAENAVDEMGNLTLGVRENTIFPETSDEDLRDVFGMGITVVTTAKNKREARAFLEQLGFPFQRGGARM